MPPRRRKAALGGAAAAAAAPAQQAGIEDLPDSLLSTIFTLAGPLKEAGPAINGTCTRFRSALFSDPERWCSFQLSMPPSVWSDEREDWLRARLGLLRQVAGLVESFSAPRVQQLLEFAKLCRGSWTVQRFLGALDPLVLTSLSLEGITGAQAPLTTVGRFTGLTSLELSSSTTPLTKNTAAVVGELSELRFLSLYSWGGSAREGSQPRLTRLPEGIVSEALPQLPHLTYLQLGGLHLPPPSQLTCVSATLQLLSLYDQAVPAGGLPSPPTRADWPALTSYSADWDIVDWRRGIHVAGQSLVSVGATLTYGATTSAAGRPVDVAAEVRLQRSYSNVGSLHDLLSTLLPAGAALTHLTLHADTNPSAESLAALRAPALSELQALTLHDCSAARLRPLVECAPHTAQLSFLSSHSYRWYSKVYELPAALVARPLRRLVLQSADLPDLPAGRWLDELEELEVRSVRRLPAALAGSPIRRLTLRVVAHYALLAPPTVADADNSLLLMPRLEQCVLSGAMPDTVLQHLRAQAPHVRFTYAF